MPGPRVLIVGAGLAGLNAAATLRQLARRAPKSKVPVQITLVEKSRSVGGRMATRRVPTDGEYGNSAAEVGEYGNSKGFVAMDTGAQLFRIRDEEFDSIVPTWVERGRAHEFGKGPPIIENLKGLMEDWQNGVNSASDSGSKQSDKSPGEIESKTCKVSGAVDPNTKYYYRGPGGMNGMARRFLEDLGEGDEVLLETEIERLETSLLESKVRGKPVFVPQWTATTKPTPTKPSEEIKADVLVATAPIPQTLKLLERGGVLEKMDKMLLQSLRSVAYSPTLAFLIPFSKPSKPLLPAPHCFTVRDPTLPIYWIAAQSPRRRDSSEGEGDGIVVLMNSVWSSENYEKPSDEILELGKRVLAHAGIPTSAGMQVKKWRYANLSSAFPARRYSVTSVPIPLPTGGQASLPLLFASDGFSSDLRGTAELDPQLGVQRATMSGVGVGRVVAGMLGLGR